jgi:hypothetical protein
MNASRAQEAHHQNGMRLFVQRVFEFNIISWTVDTVSVAPWPSDTINPNPMVLFTQYYVDKSTRLLLIFRIYFVMLFLRPISNTNKAPVIRLPVLGNPPPPFLGQIDTS